MSKKQHRPVGEHKYVHVRDHIDGLEDEHCKTCGYHICGCLFEVRYYIPRIFGEFRRTAGPYKTLDEAVEQKRDISGYEGVTGTTIVQVPPK